MATGPALMSVASNTKQALDQSVVSVTKVITQPSSSAHPPGRGAKGASEPNTPGP